MPATLLASRLPGRPTAARRRAGFSLIELLIVVVIIGILAAIAIPAFANTKGKALVTKVKSDLKNLATAQEGYFYTAGEYTTDLSRLDLTPSPGVTLNVGFASAGGWSATGSAAGANPTTCAIFYGSAPPVAPATIEGQLTCQ